MQEGQSARWSLDLGNQLRLQALVCQGRNVKSQFLTGHDFLLKYLLKISFAISRAL